MIFKRKHWCSKFSVSENWNKSNLKIDRFAGEWNNATIFNV